MGESRGKLTRPVREANTVVAHEETLWDSRGRRACGGRGWSCHGPTPQLLKCFVSSLRGKTLTGTASVTLFLLGCKHLLYFF